MGEKPENHSLDRIDNSIGYSKENCKWSTITEQNRIEIVRIIKL